MLNESRTHPRSFYNTPAPGHLQYHENSDVILSYDLTTIENDNTLGFELTSHSIENLRRVLPYTQNINNWKVLLMMKTTDGLHLKSALVNKKNGEIALLSGNCDPNYESRTVASHENGWNVCQSRMLGPYNFWKELQVRLATSL